MKKSIEDQLTAIQKIMSKGDIEPTYTIYDKLRACMAYAESRCDGVDIELSLIDESVENNNMTKEDYFTINNYMARHHINVKDWA